MTKKLLNGRNEHTVQKPNSSFRTTLLKDTL